MLSVSALQAVKATLQRHPSIAIIPLLLFLALTTGGVIGVMYAAANETQQRRMSAEGAPSHPQHCCSLLTATLPQLTGALCS
jgi:hypothetical protein